jgi:putative transposase
MQNTTRRQTVLDSLFEAFIQDGQEIQAWVVLPNHYHLLVFTTEFDRLGKLIRSVHGPSAYHWNLEDRTPKRKVWYRYTDRAMRSERHYYTTLNYIHYNPVKHKQCQTPYDWKESSVHWYREYYGQEWLRELWVKYPLHSYGEGWDDVL